MAIGAFTFFCVEKAARLTLSVSGGFIARWAYNPQQIAKQRVKVKLGEGRTEAAGPNRVWAVDFVHDQLFDGRKIRSLTIVDTFSRLSSAIDVWKGYRGAYVVTTLEKATQLVGLPKSIRVDNGPL